MRHRCRPCEPEARWRLFNLLFPGGLSDVVLCPLCSANWHLTYIPKLHVPRHLRLDFSHLSHTGVQEICCLAGGALLAHAFGPRHDRWGRGVAAVRPEVPCRPGSVRPEVLVSVAAGMRMAGLVGSHTTRRWQPLRVLSSTNRPRGGCTCRLPYDPRALPSSGMSRHTTWAAPPARRTNIRQRSAALSRCLLR